MVGEEVFTRQDYVLLQDVWHRKPCYRWLLAQSLPILSKVEENLTLLTLLPMSFLPRLPRRGRLLPLPDIVRFPTA